GLNAGIEAAAQFFSLTGPIIKQGLKSNKKGLIDALMNYQTWFVKDFAPKKVKEVAEYSTWRIRSVMRLMESMHSMKMSSVARHEYDPKELITDYFEQQANSLGER